MTDEQNLKRWLSWSDGRYPDTVVGDVIAAEQDGTIVLDDGLTTWNPLRACAFLIAIRSQLNTELQQLRASLAEKEMALNEQMVMRSQDVKTRDELIESMADTAKQWQDRYAKLQSELATAQKTHHDYVDANVRDRQRTTEERDSLKRQLQTAMEERDAANKRVIYFDNLLDEREAKHAENLSTANSRLEEAEKVCQEIGAMCRSVHDQAAGGEDVNWAVEIETRIDQLLTRLSKQQ